MLFIHFSLLLLGTARPRELGSGEKKFVLGVGSANGGGVYFPGKNKGRARGAALPKHTDGAREIQGGAGLLGRHPVPKSVSRRA